jgi:hypothetical protein
MPAASTYEFVFANGMVGSTDCQSDEQDVTSHIHSMEHPIHTTGIAKASGPSVDSVPCFTVFCQETGGNGTIHITAVEAADLESAIIAGKQQCIDDWSNGPSDDGQSRWNMDSVHCLGVAAGDVQILHWQDQQE